MLKKIFIFFIIGLVIPFSAIAKKSVSSNDYYDQIYVGEHDAKTYSGPISPDFNFSDINGRIEFVDDAFIKNFFGQYSSQELHDISTLWFNEIPTKASCPDFFLNENISYIRYLYRLLTISYLFEGVKDYNRTLFLMGESKTRSCSLNWKDTFSQCKPKEVEMKKFIKRVKGQYLKTLDKASYKRLAKSKYKLWAKKFSAGDDKSVSYYRYKEWCKSNPSDCKYSKFGNIKRALIKACDYDKEVIQQLCSETDSLFGASYVKKAVQILHKSNAGNVINMGGHGLQCIERYVGLFKERERKYPFLTKIFDIIYKDMIKKKKAYVEGELFLPGALKEFDDKGLSDFIFVAPKPKAKPKLIVVIKPKPKPTPKPKPKAVVVVKPKPKPKPIPKPVIVKKKFISQFQLAVDRMPKTYRKRSDVSMDLFKNDFIFTTKMIKTLDKPLKVYQTREALTDMKSYDKLGSKEEPVRLIFLKYLIDHDSHQGLYNIVGVLGNRFWVKNDIDKKNKPVYVELHNDKDTKYRWIITVIDYAKFNKKIVPLRKMKKVKKKK